jgi:prepilin-type N-terminal cleavage/methylation domain-containing protein
MKKYSRGFTLIELLVVIAIIGMLAAVVLASLNTARDKGADAAKKSSVNNIRAQAEIVYDNTGTYDGICEDATVVNAVTAAAGSCSDGSDVATTWAVATQLTDGATAYCVDNTGNSAEATVVAATEVADGICDGDGT